MATPVPIRELGKFGIIKDVAPFDLPINAWSDGSNVLFLENRVTSGPILRDITNVATVSALTEPVVFTTTLETATGFDPVIFATRDFRYRRYLSDSLVDISPTAAGAASDSNYTATSLGGLTYINREDFVPHYYNGAANRVDPLPNWNANWRCQALRSFKDFLVAINVTKTGVGYPTMVKWSNATQAGSVPGDWDETLLSSLAGENVISEASSALVDGGNLKNDFVIYSNREAFLMEFIGAPLVFSFRRLFSDAGMIAQNCFVEVDGKHFVFGTDDLYVHDGISKKSIANGRVKRTVFRELNQRKADRCFVFESKALSCIFFCYPSAIAEFAFPNSEYCNRAAVYNYLSDCWSFVDLPNVSSANEANLDPVLIYSAAGSSYAQIGGTFAELDDGYVRHSVLTSVASVTAKVDAHRVLGLDHPGDTKIAKPFVASLMPKARITRSGLSLEQLGSALDSRKLVTTLYPLVQSVDQDDSVLISFGRHDNPDQSPSTEAAIAFNPTTDHKINTRNTGRFVALDVEFPNTGGYYLSGYDVEVRRLSVR
jgi:hypothetical protein